VAENGLSALVAARLQSKGWTWAALAKEIRRVSGAGSHATVYDVRDGQRVPSIQTLHAIGDALGISDATILEAAGFLRAERPRDEALQDRVVAALGSVPVEDQDVFVTVVEGAALALARQGAIDGNDSAG
jgi:transcriptional regulator with XRE-family HTH domain